MKILCILLLLINFILLYYILFVLKRPLLEDYDPYDYDPYYIDERDIKQSNKILFYKLKKQYLNNVSNDDICDLIYFLENELYERGNKK